MAPTRREILVALENDMLAHHRPFSMLPDSVIHDEPDCFFYHSTINFGAFGGILAQRLTNDNVDRRIQELNAKIKRSGKDIGWVLSSLATPSNIRERLAAAGGRQVVELKGMAMDCSDMAPAPHAPDLQIVKVEDERTLADYARIYPLLFHQPVEGWIEELVAAEKHIFFHTQTPWNRWVAYENGKPVSAARTGVVDNFASLQILCTLPECRNRGIGQVIATHGLRHENRGHAIVWAGPDADRLYSRMGYREVCRTWVFDFPESE